MLGDKICRYRTAHSWTPEQMAAALNIPCAVYLSWEANQAQPSAEALAALAQIFGVSIDDLMPAAAVAQKPPKKSNRGLVIAICIVVALLVIVACGIAWWLLGNSNDDKNGKTVELSNTAAETEEASEGEETNRPLSAQEVYEKAIPSVVEIQATCADGTSTGTGFFLDRNGTVVTNYHVIEDSRSAKVFLADGAEYAVTAVLGYNSERDIAVLATTCTSTAPLPLRETPVKTGEKVYALGSSLGLTGSLSDGLISAIDREVEGQVYLQTTTPISRGNSGGPLVDETGAVVGIICATFTDGQNLNLAIPIADLNNIALDSNITLDKLFPKNRAEVTWLSEYQFEYYAPEDTYLMLFCLADQNRDVLAANGTIVLEIVNDNGDTVYNKIHNFTTSDFKTWLLDDGDELYMATIYIDPANIKKGTTQYGTVFFSAYGDGYSFETTDIDVSGLPVEEAPTTTTPSDSTATTPSNNATTQSDSTTTTTTKKPATTTTTKKATTTTHTTSNGKTCLVLDCDSPAISGSYYCTTHACKVSGCTSKKSSGKDYCTSHACLNCNKRCIKDGNYCEDHTCIVKDCTKKKEAGINYCYSHKCNALDCKKIRKNGSYYCKTHACTASDCASQKTIDKDYCSSHACIKSNCNKLRMKNRYYCKDHLCKKDGCTLGNSGGKDYCSSHGCYMDGCNNASIENGYYCKDHTCKDKDCMSKRKDNSQYCTGHACLSCSKRRIEGGYHCEDHTCKKSGCTEGRKSNSDYCYNHD